MTLRPGSTAGSGSSVRILLIAPQPFFSRRGTPIAVRSLAVALAEEGHAVELLTLPHGEQISLPGVRIRRAPESRLMRNVPIGLSWQKLVYDLSLLRRATSIVREFRPHVVHGVEEAVFIAWLLKRRFGLPFVYDMDSIMSGSVAEMGRLYRPVAWVCRLLERAAIRRAAGVLAVCPALADYAREAAPDGFIGVLPDTPLFEEAPPGGGRSELSNYEGTKLLYVGNLEPYQGIDLLVSGFRIAAGEFGDTTLFVIGGSSEQVAEQERAAADLVEAGRIRFLGQRPLEELGRHLAEADILVSPRCGGVNTPLKIFSYMQAGKAILATRLPTHTQVLDDLTALLVDPDPSSMAEGIRKLVRSSDLRARLGNAARRRVNEEYSRERYRERLRGFYAGLNLRNGRLAAAGTG